MPKILFISAFGDIDDFTNNDRLNSVIRYSKGLGESTVLTSDFSHKFKQKRSGKESINNVNVHYIPTLFYYNNAGFRRLISHTLLGVFSLPYLLRLVPKHDLIYVLSPPITLPLVSIVIGKLFKKKVAVDFTDLWPQAFGLLGKSVLRKVFLTPALLGQKLILKLSHTRIVINSKYKSELEFNKMINCVVLPLGISQNTPMKDALVIDGKLDSILSQIQNKCVFVYAGNLGAAYDFNLMFDIVQKASVFCDNVFLLLLGDGPLKLELETILKENYNFSFCITGRLEYAKFTYILKFCDFGFNIYKNTPYISTSYKMYDYLKCNVWILNNLLGDSAKLIDNNRIGVNILDVLSEKKLNEISELMGVKEVEKRSRFLKVNDELSAVTLTKKWQAILKLG